jgi:Sortase domain
MWQKKHILVFVLGWAFLLLVGGFLMLTVDRGGETTMTVLPESPRAALVTATTSDALPVLLEIPRIQLAASFTPPLGLLPSGEVAVPATSTEVGWYQHSPSPGLLGPSVILGHVDSYAGPAVFWRLRELAIGDEISITKADASTVVFVVESIETYAQDTFPTAEVYGNIAYAGLRLVTCAGTYSKTSQRYSHNTVVFARLKE